MGDDDEARVRELLEQCGDEALLKLSVPPMVSASSSFSSPLEIGTDDKIGNDLLARFQRLKAPPPTPRSITSTNPNTTIPDDVSTPSLVPSNSSSNSDVPEDILGSDLAARLAALKTSSFSRNHSGVVKPNTAELIPQNRSRFSNSNATSLNVVDDVEKLLSSVTDLVRLEKKRLDGNDSALSYRQSSRLHPLDLSHLHEDEDEDEDDDEDELISQSEVKLVMDWARDAARLDPEEEEEEEDKETPKPSL